MDEVYFISFLILMCVAVGLGLIPASIAKGKGYSFGLWWFYGFMLFIVAIIHVSLIPDKKALQNQNLYNPSVPLQPSFDVRGVADEIKKYKELLDQGVISQEEFQAKKEQLLKLL